MARFPWTRITLQSDSPRRAVGFARAEVRKVKSGPGSVPSPPRVPRANLLVGSVQEQLNEESAAVPPGPEGPVTWAGADGDVNVRALMEAILFWQSSGDLFVCKDTDEREDGGMTHRSTVNRPHLVAGTDGMKIALSKKALVSRARAGPHSTPRRLAPFGVDGVSGCCPAQLTSYTVSDWLSACRPYCVVIQAPVEEHSLPIVLTDPFYLCQVLAGAAVTKPVALLRQADRQTGGECLPCLSHHDGLSMKEPSVTPCSFLLGSSEPTTRLSPALAVMSAG
ncbi:unnamed protein product [Pleuronectes platessa]|uniref:Uncharacterized protein n=1 Tax=Pleuronectes platessa TaxID=8262 RepID=A0A9N7Z551_PLEPL|nr:unnamed protein product [Pleuronectes platessa]